MFFPFPIRRAALAALISACASVVWAVDPLSLPEALRIAADHSQQLKALDALRSAAREQAVAAGQLPDPVLTLGVDNLPVNGPDAFNLTNDFMTMRRIGVMQEVVSSKKLRLRTQKFGQEALRVQAQRQWALSRLKRDTAMAWLDVYYTRGIRALVQQQIDETGLQAQAADIAYRSGKGSQADVFAARAAILGLEDRLRQSDAQLRKARLILARWVGSEAERPLSGQPPWQTTPGLGSLSGEHLRQHSDLLAMRAEIDAAQTDVQLAQANTQADWSVEASYSQRGPAYSNMLSFGVSIPLQLDRKNRQHRETAVKQAMVHEAQARYEDLLRSHEAEVRGLVNDWQSGKERLARIQEALIPTTQQRVEATLIAYRTGKTDLAIVLAARGDAIDARMQALTVELDTARAWAQLNFLLPERDGVATTKDLP